jgi:hypothetical protein
MIVLRRRRTTVRRTEQNQTFDEEIGKTPGIYYGYNIPVPRYSHRLSRMPARLLGSTLAHVRA